MKISELQRELLFMLQKIRDRISGWIAGVVIALVGAAFVFWGVDFYFEQSNSNQHVAATVNGTKITDIKVNDFFTQLQRQMLMKNAGQSITDEMSQQLKAYALQSLITQTALLTTLQRDGFRVGVVQVEAMIAQTPQFQVNGQFSQEKLEQFLMQQSVSPMQFIQRIQSEWLINQALDGITASSFVLPNEVNQVYSLLHQSRAFGYLIVPLQQFSANTVISDQTIQQYYHQNKANFMSPDKARVSYLELSPETISKTISVTAAQAKQYYESHPLNFKKQSFEQAEKNIMALLKHERVSDILTKQSNQLADLTFSNPDSLQPAASALHLPIQTSHWITKAGEKTGVLSNPKVLNVIFSDSVFKQNNNSNPIDLPDGTQIVVRIDQKQLSQPMPLAEVKNQIQQHLIQKQASGKAGLLAYQLQTKLAAGENPEELAKKNGLTWHSIALMTQQEKSIAVPKAILSTVFSTQTKKAEPGKPMGVNTVALDHGDFAVIAILQVKKAHVDGASLKEKAQLQQQLETSWGQLLQRSYVASVMHASKVTVHKIAR